MVEDLRFPDRGELAPIEHLFIGSTPPVNGAAVNVVECLNRARSGVDEARKALLTPVLLQNQFSEGARELVVKGRQRDREEQALRGAIAVLATNGIMAAHMRGVAVCLDLSDLDVSGLVLPFWKIYLIDKKGGIANDEEMIAGQQIHDRYRSEMVLGEVEAEQRTNGSGLCRTLKLNQ